MVDGASWGGSSCTQEGELAWCPLPASQWPSMMEEPLGRVLGPNPIPMTLSFEVVAPYPSLICNRLLCGCSRSEHLCVLGNPGSALGRGHISRDRMLGSGSR